VSPEIQTAPGPSSVSSAKPGQGGETDQEEVGRRAVGEAAGHLQGRPLRRGQPVAVVQQRHEQPVQGREREVRLGFDAVDPQRS
jgi:hypothetical protein